jgi:hypothetical protein
MRMNTMYALSEEPPEQPPEELPEQPPTERGRTAYRVLLVILLASLLLVALVFVFPLLTSSRNQLLVSSDWSGYTVASDLNYPQPRVTSVNASWTVPTVNLSIAESFSAVWIGVGGQFDSTLIQAGTEQDSRNGKGTYSAWYELLPAYAVTVDSLSVMPGDRITVSISVLDPTTSTWSIELHDATNEQSFQKSVFYFSSMLSAEWVVERLIIGGRYMTLADFGQVTFTGCVATLGSTVGTVSSFPHAQIAMYNRQNVPLVSVSPLTSNGASFTVNYLG